MNNLCEKCIGCSFRKEPRQSCEFYINKEYLFNKVTKHKH